MYVQRTIWPVWHKRELWENNLTVGTNPTHPTCTCAVWSHAPQALWGNSYDHSSCDHTRWRTSATVGSDRARLWCLYANLCSCISTQNGASSVSILRAMLCWFVQLFPKYGGLKLSQYDRNLQTRHRRYDRNCPGAMVVTVEKWS